MEIIRDEFDGIPPLNINYDNRKLKLMSPLAHLHHFRLVSEFKDKLMLSG